LAPEIYTIANSNVAYGNHVISPYDYDEASNLEDNYMAISIYDKNGLIERMTRYTATSVFNETNHW
jgi:hypothetical protein